MISHVKKRFKFIKTNILRKKSSNQVKCHRPTVENRTNTSVCLPTSANKDALQYFEISFVTVKTPCAP